MKNEKQVTNEPIMETINVSDSIIRMYAEPLKNIPEKKPISNRPVPRLSHGIKLNEVKSPEGTQRIEKFDASKLSFNYSNGELIISNMGDIIFYEKCDLNTMLIIVEQFNHLKEIDYGLIERYASMTMTIKDYEYYIISTNRKETILKTPDGMIVKMNTLSLILFIMGLTDL